MRNSRVSIVSAIVSDCFAGEVLHDVSDTWIDAERADKKNASVGMAAARSTNLRENHRL